MLINDVFQFLGLSDKEWMPKCNATYKTNIKNLKDGLMQISSIPLGI